MMGVVNVVLLVLLVWTFTSVCVADDDITINCEDVTAPVGDKITLTCRVTYLKKGCCMTMYKFINTAAADDPTICREDFNKDPCIEMSSFSCPYTANKAMTTTFKFHLQTTCGIQTAYFSVSTTDITSNCEDVTAHVGDKINLTCTVSHLNQNCCVKSYKFDETAVYNEEICRKEFSSDPCKQESRFSCPYTANKPMTTKFKFFLHTTCEIKETEFSVSTTAGGSNTLKDKPDNTIKCEVVTAPVGDKINLNCIVTNLNKNCCMIMYKFIDTAEYKNIQNICKEEFRSDSCIQESRFSCPYTANKAIKTKFKFFLQSNCEKMQTDFSVITTGAVEDVTGGTNTLRYKEVLAVIIPVIVCLIVIIIIFILKKKLNFNTSGFHRNYDTDVSERNISLCSDREIVEQEHHINM